MSITVTFRVPDSLLSTLAPGFGTPALPMAKLKSDLLSVLNAALSSEVEPVELSEDDESAPATRVNLSLPDSTAKPLARLALREKCSEGVICRRLAVAMSRRPSTANTLTEVACPAPLRSAIDLLNLKRSDHKLVSRPAQNQFYLNLDDSLMNDGRIGLCEAATGTGKTMSMLLAAKDRLQSAPTSRLVIAVPTVSVMRQFASEYRRLVDAGVEMPVLRHIVGRRAFVSPDEIREIIASGKGGAHCEQVAQWVESGGPAPDDVINHPWLLSTLESIAPDFPGGAAILSDDASEDDPGLIAYQSQFIRSENSLPEIMLVTHAMLAIDTRRRMSTRDEGVSELFEKVEAERKRAKALIEIGEKEGVEVDAKAAYAEYVELKGNMIDLQVDISRDSGKLPPWRYLMVDEAHLLENNYSNALSEYVSLVVFERHCVEFRALGGKLSKQKLDVIQTALRDISSVGKEIDQLWLDEKSGAARAVIDSLLEIVDTVSCLEKIPKKKGSHADEASVKLSVLRKKIVEQTQSIKFACETNGGGAALLKYSPVRQFPQLYVGRRKVTHYLEFTWATARSGAAVSATLYLPKGEGFTSWYQRKLLGISDARAKDYAPVASAWLYQQVEAVYTPPPAPFVPKFETEERLVLRPVSRSDNYPDKATADAAELKWMQDVARALCHIYDTAQGGVLVLMTSYDSVRLLKNLLSGDLISDQALICASTDESLMAQKSRYVAQSLAGERPLWLAVGGAWTGLDLSGKDCGVAPSQDYTLTDLVIPRVPFGMNHSITHASRMRDNAEVSWEVLDTMFRFKQGMGRLIRDDGLPPGSRRIWVLDNRMNDTRKNLDKCFYGIRAIISGYRNKTANLF